MYTAIDDVGKTGKKLKTKNTLYNTIIAVKDLIEKRDPDFNCWCF